MISEHRHRVRLLIGEQRSDDLRNILKNILVKKWEIPHHRFSPLMVEHLLYYVAKSVPIINTELFVRILSIKFAEEYGYEQFPDILPKLVEDLVTTLRTYCTNNFNINKVAPHRAIEKVFKEPILLFLDGYKVDCKSEESIWEISGLPLSFLATFFDNFSRVLDGHTITSDMENNFGQLFRDIRAECTSRGECLT